jgi:hypothetical protein
MQCHAGIGQNNLSEYLKNAEQEDVIGVAIRVSRKSKLLVLNEEGGGVRGEAELGMMNGECGMVGVGRGGKGVQAKKFLVLSLRLIRKPIGRRSTRAIILDCRVIQCFPLISPTRKKRGQACPRCPRSRHSLDQRTIRR